MLGIKKDDIDDLVHLLLGVLVQGQDFYNQQSEEIRDFFGDEAFDKAEGMLKSTRIYEILSCAE